MPVPHTLPWRINSDGRNYVAHFRDRNTNHLISELSTKRFFIEGDSIIEEYNEAGTWKTGRSWKTQLVQIIF